MEVSYLLLEVLGSGWRKERTVRELLGGFEGLGGAAGSITGFQGEVKTVRKRLRAAGQRSPAPVRPAGQEELQVGPLVYIRKPSDKRKFRKSTYLWAFEACLLSTVYLISSSIHM